MHQHKQYAAIFLELDVNLLLPVTGLVLVAGGILFALPRALSVQTVCSGTNTFACPTPSLHSTFYRWPWD